MKKKENNISITININTTDSKPRHTTKCLNLSGVRREDARVSYMEAAEEKAARAHIHPRECGFVTAFCREATKYKAPARRPDFTRSASRLCDVEAVSTLRRVLKRGGAAPRDWWKDEACVMRHALLTAARNPASVAKIPRDFLRGLTDAGRYHISRFVLPSGSRWWAAVARIPCEGEAAGTCWLFRTESPNVLKDDWEGVRLTDVYRIVPA